MTVGDLGWGGAALTGKMSGMCFNDHTGGPGCGACYTLGTKSELRFSSPWGQTMELISSCHINVAPFPELHHFQ